MSKYCSSQEPRAQYKLHMCFPNIIIMTTGNINNNIQYSILIQTIARIYKFYESVFIYENKNIMHFELILFYYCSMMSHAMAHRHAWAFYFRCVFFSVRLYASQSHS